MPDSKRKMIKKLQTIVKKMKRVSKRPVLGKTEWTDFEIPDQESGAVVEPRRITKQIKAFRAKEMKSVSSFTQPKVEIPNWMKAKIQRKTSSPKVLKYLMARVRRAPSKRALLLAQSIMNDIGRKKGGSRYLKAFLKENDIKKFIELTNRKK